MTSALQCRHQHNYRLSAYERKANDFYPTPSDLAISLALGLPRLGLDLPRVALDPCGGDGALRRSLAHFGVDVRFRLHRNHDQHAPHTNEACAIVRNLVALVEGQHVDFVAALFKSIWGAEPGRLSFFNRPSFYGEVLCCWRPRWIPGSRGSPMHAYAWYVWRKEPRNGPSLKVRVGRHEIITAMSAVSPPTRG